MRKSTGHKHKYTNKCEIPQSPSNDGTAARTRPFSFDEIMLRRKNKKQSGSVEDQQGDSEVASVKGAQSVTGLVESERRERRDVGGHEQHASKEPLKVHSRAKEDKSKMREGKIVEGEYRESNNAQRRSKVGSDNAKDRRKERGINEKRKNQDRSSDDSDNEYGKRHGKDSAIKARDRNVERNRGRSEHVSKTRTQNGYDERTRDQDAGKKHESRTWHDSDTSERKQKKGTSESRHEDLKLKGKWSRSRERTRDKRRSNSPSPRGYKQRLHDVQEHEELSAHSSKDRLGRFDSNVDRKRISINGSSNKSKRHETAASRLGGYSPRKRRSEAAVKTPSPTSRSPEKNAGWDSPPVKMEGSFISSFQSDLLSLNKTELSNRQEVASVVPLISSIPKPTFGLLSSIPSMMNSTVDSVQLTQATRPKRRIYVENLPSSASEAAVMEWLGGYLRPSGVNHVQGTSPCISCIVNKEKGQALVEFLTPEDASTALSLDGRSFSGNILKIRRPKDYVDASTGVSEKPVAGAVSVKNIVEDSPNKIFIGGLSKLITSKMLMEIASAFGPLKAYHFEANADLDGPYAFVEYVDQSVTVKACVGLNGMKLGGKVLTVTQATPDASSLENHGDQPFYGTPEHARPLLEEPTQVLKLSNVLDPNSLLSLSEPELEEILEDVRLECTRFGMVKSINIIKQNDNPTSSDTVKVAEEDCSMADIVTEDQSRERGSEPSGSDKDQEIKEPADGNDCHDDKPEEVNEINGDNHENKIVKDETSDNSVLENQNLEENSNQISSAIDQMELNDLKSRDDFGTENKPLKLEMVSLESRSATKDEASDLNDTFKVGCVLVEYKRTEASSMAAHCLHGRIFDGRTVSVGFVAHDVYCARFRK
ncbi:splicing factor U2af large subunit B [Cynara cardunculus var. scolymus]|uniref:splicing factor U2af large subunit B n=1 Tax=Cynara cardunculus var. scolymus TaxID=59895 RepID=UPI000D625839|nr:splicing factor U2af large subunit B [Cynara cardunculus var. scolymus]XP_024984562.1 splicing factor U2af large subunit B [Cynara cardunculus var. scolymus]XP_024984563.1 splicing factor U2af large subunit B [Cynara cardunculus var. scolymus]XP_024984564.1 splicing factor U2af large subunit B [Cynara cardunculus var. scolymus]